MTRAVASLFMATYSPICVYAQAYSYVREGDFAYVTANASDVLSAMGYEVGDGEREYLSANESFGIAYSNSIPASYVIETFNNDVVCVMAGDYSFRSISGETVTWSPTAAYIGETPMSVTSDGWQLDVDNESGDTVRVEYSLDVAIDANDINEFVNKAYFAAKQANDKMESENERYEAQLAQYNADYQRYLTYLSDQEQYEKDEAVYKEYLARLASWELQSAVYKEYLQEYDKYLAELEECNKYDEKLQKYYADLAAYQQYLADVDEYEKAMDNFEQQMQSADVQTVLYHLSILDYLTKTVNLNRTIYGSIMGNSVTQVLSQTEALVLAGAERAAVERANNATIALRSLFAQYAEATTNEQKYAFYISCYSSLKSNLILLLQTLDYFYGFSMIRTAIKQYDKVQEFEILLAQLYYISVALSDSKVPNYVQAFKYDKTYGGYFDASYRVGPNKTLPSALVGQGNSLEDKQNGEPVQGGYVQIPIQPVRPTEVLHPGAIPEQISPIEPEEVQDPGDRPVVVDKPTPPTKVSKPTAPIAYQPTEQENKLIQMYGGLSQRANVSEDYVLTLKTSVTKYFRNAKITTLRFYDSIDSDQPMYVVDAAIGTYVQYPYALPVKTKTGYLCEFDYWQDGDGNKVETNRIVTDHGDLSLYPHFKETPLMYDVIWYVNGQRINDKCAFDSSPVYDEVKFGLPLTKQSSDVREYRFAGWEDSVSYQVYASNESLPIMKGSVCVYKAIFESSYVVEWVVDGSRVRQSVWAGQTPVYDGETEKEADAYCRYRFVGWDKEVTPASADVAYIAQYEKEYLCGYSNTGAKVTCLDGVYIADCTKSTAMRFNIGGMLNHCVENGASMQINLPKATLYFSKAAVYSANEQGASAMLISIVGVGSKEYSFLLRFFDSLGERIELSEVYGTLTAKGTFDAENSYLVLTDQQGNSSDVRFNISATEISFTIKTNVTYDLTVFYTIGIVPNANVTIQSSITRCKAGETVVLALSDLAPGVCVSSVYAIDSLGNNVSISDFSFVMPSSSVTVGAVCSYIEYLVTFKADGKTLITQTYRYGDQIISPISPIKPSDSEYEYIFVGWDKPLGTVTEDVEFNAVFDKKAIPIVEQTDSTLNKLIKVAYVAVPTVVVLIIGLTVFLIIRRRAKRKIKK